MFCRKIAVLLILIAALCNRASAQAPTLSNVHIQSSNSSNTLAKAGDIITLSFTASTAIQTPTVTIAGVAATVTNTAANDWETAIVVDNNTPEGLAAISIAFANLVGDPGTTVVSTSDGSSVTVDRTPTTLTNIHIQSNNSNTSAAKQKDIVTLTFTANDPIRTPVVTLAGKTAVVTNTSGNNWQAVSTVTASTPQGVASVSIAFADLANNTGTTVTNTSDGSSVTVSLGFNTLDRIGFSANRTVVAAYSLRRLSSSYTGNLIQVRRSTDNATADFGFDANGMLDTTAVTAFTGSGDGFVSYWYDQSGGGYDAYQTDYTRQPRIVSAGKMELKKGVPTVRFLSTSISMLRIGTASDIGIQNANFEFNAVASPAKNSQANIMGLANDFDLYTLLTENGAVKFNSTGFIETRSAGGRAFNGNFPIIASARYDGTNIIARKNGTDGTPTASPYVGANPSTFIIGKNSSWTLFEGGISEVLIFPSNLTVNDRTALETNQTAYYFDPTLSNVHIQSNRTNTTLATAGDMVTLSFTASRPLQTSVITIAGISATVTNLSGNDWQATISVPGGATEGTAVLNMTVTDLAGNTKTFTNTSDASTVTIYTSPPVISNIHIQSNNTLTNAATTGNIITLSFTGFVQVPSITIAGVAANITRTSGNNWQGTVTVDNSTTEGPAAISILVTDMAGNGSITYTGTTDGSQVTVDNTALPPVSVHIQSNNTNTSNAKAGDVIKVSFTASETIQVSSMTIAGLTASVNNLSGNNWEGTVTVDNSVTEGIAAIYAVFTDALSNSGTFTTTTDASSVTVDLTAPTVSNVHIQSNSSNTTVAPLGAVVTVSFTAGEAIQTPTVTIAGASAAVTNTSGNNWQATLTVDAGTTEGVAAMSIAYTDLAGHAGGTVTATGDGSSVLIDRTVPTLSTIHIQSNNSNTEKAQAGDVITVSFTSSETIQIPTVLISGETATVTPLSGNNWQATLTVSNSTSWGLAFINIAYSDQAGNLGATVKRTTDASAVFIGLKPVITSFTPSTGVSGPHSSTLVTITGSGFNTTAANNIVFFGPVSTRAITADASGTHLSVKVPSGATTQHISVLNTETHLTGHAYAKQFVPGFYNEGNMKLQATANFAYSYTPKGSGSYFKTGDIDGDGKPDLVLINSNSFSVLLNNSSNGVVGFDTDHITTVNPTNGIQALAIGDMNGDGKQDIVVFINTGGSLNIEIFRNASSPGSVSFAAPYATQTTGESKACDFSLTDVDDDGRTDIVIPADFSASASLRLGVLMNDYTTTDGFQFYAKTINGVFLGFSKRAKALVRGDFDGDGKIDVGVVSFGATASTNPDSTLVRLFYNKSTFGNPSFTDSWQTRVFMGIGYNQTNALSHANLVAAGDVDGDGKPDLASVNYAAGAGNTVTTLNQSTVGVFSFPTRTATAFGTTPPGSIAMGDFDGDGKPDIACTIEASNEVYVYRNNSTTGNIRFAARVTIPTAITSPQYLEFCDLNADGIPDLITANSAGLAVQAGIGKVKYIPVRIPF